MRTSSRAVSVAWVALAIFAMTPIYAFDGTKDTAQDAAAVAVIPAPGGGVMEKPVPPADIPQQTALSTLQYAADDGHPAAQWKLGRMYADGIVVPRDDLRAFDYFSRIANQHAEDSPAAPPVPASSATDTSTARSRAVRLNHLLFMGNLQKSGVRSLTRIGLRPGFCPGGGQHRTRRCAGSNGNARDFHHAVEYRLLPPCDPGLEWCGSTRDRGIN